MSGIVESYKYTIIRKLRKSGTPYLLLHMDQYWCACSVDKDKQDLPMIMYCSSIMYKYYSYLGFHWLRKNEEGKDTQNGIFNNIPYFIKNRHRVNCNQDCFVMYNDKLLIRKIEVIPPILDSMIPVDCCKNISLISLLMTWHPSLIFLEEQKR